MKKSIETLIGLGYKENEAASIVGKYSLHGFKDDTLSKYIMEVFNYLSNFHSLEEIIKMTKSFPQLLYLSKENIKNKVEFLESFGFKKEEIIKITRTFPVIYGYSNENMASKMNFFVSLGYTKEEVVKMIKKMPSIYGLSKKSLTDKISFLQSLGYSKNDILKMTKQFPPLYLLSKENIASRIIFLENLGYTKEEILIITKILPSIFSFSEENIKEKITYLNKIGLGFVVIEKTMELMQSVKLTYARYEFLTKEMGIVISNENYVKLFFDETKFKKKYGITKQELLEKYSYDLHCNEKRNKAIKISN